MFVVDGYDCIRVGYGAEMINSMRSVMRALLLSFFYYSPNKDNWREVFTHNDMDSIPPDCVAEIIINVRHKGLDIEPEPLKGKE